MLGQKQSREIGARLFQTRGHFLHLNLDAIEVALRFGLGEDSGQFPCSLVHGLQRLNEPRALTNAPLELLLDIAYSALGRQSGALKRRRPFRGDFLKAMLGIRS